MNYRDFKYEEDDIISDTIINFYKNSEEKELIEPVIEKYINNKKFFEYIQKNFLINKICTLYLLRLYNDFEEDNIIEEYDCITSVNTTRWI